jgi:tRNA A37 threonylcarbamoyladenosine synthetase subunit TsaC/SUA5/YrdC
MSIKKQKSISMLAGVQVLVPENERYFTGRELLRIENCFSWGGVVIGVSDSCMCLWGLPMTNAVSIIDRLRQDNHTPLVLSVTGVEMASRFVSLSVVDMRLAGAGWPGHITLVAGIKKDHRIPELKTTAKDVATTLRGHSGADPKKLTLGLRVSAGSLESRLVAAVGVPLVSAALFDTTGAVIKDPDVAIDLLVERLAAGGVPRSPILVVKPRHPRFEFASVSTVLETVAYKPTLIHRQGEKYDATRVEVIEHTPMPGEWGDAT